MLFNSERLLKWFLRWVGVVSLLALVAVFMPYSWMNAAHQALGLGEMPRQPVAGYLARTASAFYALQGGLLIFLSLNLRAHISVLLYLGFSFLIFGGILVWVDLHEKLPLFWVLWEGPVVLLIGAVIFRLTLNVRRTLSKTKEP